MRYFLFFMVSIHGHSATTISVFNTELACRMKANNLVVNSFQCKIADSCQWDCRGFSKSKSKIRGLTV